MKEDTMVLLQLSPFVMPSSTNSNSSGFTAPLAGDRDTDGSFSSRSDIGYFWSTSENAVSGGWSRYVRISHSQVNRYVYTKSFGFSVRCVKN